MALIFFNPDTSNSLKTGQDLPKKSKTNSADTCSYKQPTAEHTQCMLNFSNCSPLADIKSLQGGRKFCDFRVISNINGERIY